MEYHDFKASSEQDYEYEVDNFQNNRDQAFMASIQPDDEYEVDNYLNNSIGLCVCMCVCECDCVSVCVCVCVCVCVSLTCIADMLNYFLRLANKLETPKALLDISE